jgi:hypothetical protein
MTIIVTAAATNNLFQPLWQMGLYQLMLRPTRLTRFTNA